jgi:UDP-3-O-[3-hydroxymyristoyl] N-acetylglucosamine deacetylase
MQHTLKSDIIIEDIGLHSGKAVRMRILPAQPGHGIVFIRSDLSENNKIPALWNRVVDTRLCTVLANEDGASVGTIEHLMAALRGCGVDNALIEVNAPELPVLDGSSAEFVEKIDAAGLQVQASPRRAIKVLKEIVVRDEDKEVRLSPSPLPSFGGEIHYDHPDIGVQRYETQLVNGNFRHNLADCRTFGFMKDVETMRAAGLALGGSLDNAIVLDENGVLNPDGLRRSDEFIRHKILDAIGDLYLAGGPILGAYNGICGGHALNNAVLKALFADERAWMPVDLFTDPVEDTRQRPVLLQNTRASAVAIA